jgi:competence protein ComEC
MKKLAWLLAGSACAIYLGTMAPPAVTAEPRPLEIYFVDVEGGAATLMVTPAGESVLVDSGWPGQGGRDPRRIQAAAKDAGLSQIDHYVTTHWHTDHYGGIEELAKLLPVKRYWDRGIPEQATDGAKDFPMLIGAYKRASGGTSSALKPGDTIPLRASGRPLRLQVVSSGGKVIGEGSEELPGSCAKHPAAPVTDESDNKLSVGLLLTQGDFQFLNLGDLTWNVEHKLVCPKNRVGQVDLWQVTHHGWEASGNPALIEAIQPTVAMMVNGPKKGASPRTIRALKQSSSLQALYQLHRAVTNAPEENTSPDRIANLEENCTGEYLKARLSPAGDSFTVSLKDGSKAGTFKVR